MNFHRSILFYTIFLTACESKNNQVVTKLYFNEGLLDSITKIYSNNIAILSCLNCDCFRQEYNKEFARSKSGPIGYTLIADTNCVKLSFPIAHMSQKLIDSLSDNIYNLVLIHGKGQKASYRILRVNESTRIQKEADKFFGN